VSNYYEKPSAIADGTTANANDVNRVADAAEAGFDATEEAVNNGIASVSANATSAAASATTATEQAAIATTKANESTAQTVIATTKAGEASESASTALSHKNAAAASAVSLNIAAIDASISATAVDVFIYETSKDSDGGAWRKRTQATSWYNETLNTSTRGSRKEFPAVAVIVAEGSPSYDITIYDGDDPSMPMWMVFDNYNARPSPAGRMIGTGDNGTPIAVGLSAVNGQFCVGTRGSTGSAGSWDGLFRVKFIEDTGIHHSVNATYSDYSGSGIVDRNSFGYLAAISAGNYTLVSTQVNDVAMTVLPNAPIDSATGLPIPTIAVATNGGVSVIKDDGSVVSRTVGASFKIRDIEFGEGSEYWYQSSYTTTPTHDVRITHVNSGNLDSTAAIAEYGGVASFEQEYTDFYFSRGSLHTVGLGGDTQAGATQITSAGAVGGSRGLTWIKDNQVTPTKGSVAYITSDYNTGWMHGDIKLAALSDTDDTDVTGGTEADRSVNGNNLTVHGTITKEPVATGADLVAYSGFSSSNYLEQPYNSDLDFGTGDFSIMGWVKVNSSYAGTDYIVSRGTHFGYAISVNAGDIYFYADGNSVITALPSTGSWVFVVCGVRGGNRYVSANAGSETTSVITTSVDEANAPLFLGVYDTSGGAPLDGSIANLRISATAPSAAQIKKAYEDEKKSFQEDAQSTLYGTSDAVTALAHDDSTNLLHVGTSAGRSVFQGLRRVDNTTTAVGAAISASNGLVVED
jgi:hypothetical protein